MHIIILFTNHCVNTNTQKQKNKNKSILTAFNMLIQSVFFQEPFSLTFYLSVLRFYNLLQIEGYVE